MIEQLSAIRYTIRNYGVLVDAMSKKPLCGERELSKMPEVERFIKQYEYGEHLTNCNYQLYLVFKRLLLKRRLVYSYQFWASKEVWLLITPP